MVSIICQSDGHCPYLYYCNAHNNCDHQPIFPLTFYPIIIYCLFPLASALCNISGNSFGQYKVLLLMDLLDYSESRATVLSYPLTVGTALFNFINLIPRRHPQKNTSAVDFNIVMLIIPSVLYGSTIGALVNKFIPPIVADCLIILILGGYSIKFFMKFYNYRQMELKQKEQANQRQLQGLQMPTQQAKAYEQTLNTQLMPKKNQQIVEMDTTQINGKNESSVRQQIEVVQIPLIENPYQVQLNEQLAYEATYHVPHIIATIIIFGVFQTLSFLAQGKIISFKMCTSYYVIGICCLTVIYLSFVIVMFFYTKRKMMHYKKISYIYEYPLGNPRFYTLVVLASFLGGFNGGVFGLGDSTTIIICLLLLQIEPIIVSATVGYQVVFAGLGSLCQAFATGQISVEDAGFFLGITFVIGGTLSFFTTRMVRKLNISRVNQVIMVIVGSLTGSSSLAMIANIVLSYNHFGALYMRSSPFQC